MANFEGDEYGANLIGANLRGVNLNGAELRLVDLSGADLTLRAISNRSGARQVAMISLDLCGASFDGAVCHQANSQNANLEASQIEKASLKGAKPDFAP